MVAMNDAFESNTDELLELNAAYAQHHGDNPLDVAPGRNLAVVACMDARMDVYQILGIANGDAHIIRNGGGVITDDVIRSLVLSQRALGTREIILMHHTRCGLSTVTDDGFKDDLEAELGIRPSWAVESFTDPHANVRQSMKRLYLTPFLPHKDHIRGFVFDVDSGKLHEVAPES